jgi:hypothetical protein
MNAPSETKKGGSATVRPLNSNDFQTAAVAAQQSHSRDWHEMSCREQAKAIYAEPQKIDAGRVKATVDGRQGRSTADVNK